MAFQNMGGLSWAFFTKGFELWQSNPTLKAPSMHDCTVSIMTLGSCSHHLHDSRAVPQFKTT